jgi:hypothetical protein
LTTSNQKDQQKINFPIQKPKHGVLVSAYSKQPLLNVPKISTKCLHEKSIRISSATGWIKPWKNTILSINSLSWLSKWIAIRDYPLGNAGQPWIPMLKESLNFNNSYEIQRTKPPLSGNTLLKVQEGDERFTVKLRLFLLLSSCWSV